MNTAHVGSNFNIVPSNSKVLLPELIALWMVRICWATTDNTSKSILLNSSKHDHAPQEARPYKLNISRVINIS